MFKNCGDARRLWQHLVVHLIWCHYPASRHPPPASDFQCACKNNFSTQHSRWFDGDAALLLVFASVCEAHLSGLGWSYDPRFGHQRVGQSGLAMIHVGDHRYVSDVGLLVHDGPDLIHREFHLFLEPMCRNLQLHSPTSALSINPAYCCSQSMLFFYCIVIPLKICLRDKPQYWRDIWIKWLLSMCLSQSSVQHNAIWAIFTRYTDYLWSRVVDDTTNLEKFCFLARKLKDQKGICLNVDISYDKKRVWLTRGIQGQQLVGNVMFFFLL